MQQNAKKLENWGAKGRERKKEINSLKNWTIQKIKKNTNNKDSLNHYFVRDASTLFDNGSKGIVVKRIEMVFLFSHFSFCSVKNSCKISPIFDDWVEKEENSIALKFVIWSSRAFLFCSKFSSEWSQVFWC